MGKRRRKFKKPRHRMRTTFDGQKGWFEKPLNNGEIKELDPDLPKVGPLTLNSNEPSVHHSKGSRLIYPPHSPFGYIRPPSTLRPEFNFYPTRFPGVPPGRHAADLRAGQRRADELMCQFLYKGDHKQVRLWFLPSKSECIIVETDTIARYRRESILYTSLMVAKTMYELGKISWKETTVFDLPKEKAD